MSWGLWYWCLTSVLPHQEAWGAAEEEFCLVSPSAAAWRPWEGQAECGPGRPTKGELVTVRLFAALWRVSANVFHGRSTVFVLRQLLFQRNSTMWSDYISLLFFKQLLQAHFLHDTTLIKCLPDTDTCPCGLRPGWPTHTMLMSGVLPPFLADLNFLSVVLFGAQRSSGPFWNQSSPQEGLQIAGSGHPNSWADPPWLPSIPFQPFPMPLTVEHLSHIGHFTSSLWSVSH